MPTITLLTDFGLRDGYSGVLKGVIWNIFPDAQIADISHTIHPQDVREGALALMRTVFFFPEGSIHLAVVDPGVGTQRRPIAMRLGSHAFVGPDNGLFSLVLEYAERQDWPVEIVHLDQPRYWQPTISRVFHGRDVFAPVAAHLAAGVPINQVGKPIRDPVRLALPQPQRNSSGWHGQVISVDYFGNLSTNLKREQLERMGALTVTIAGQTILGLARTFGDRPTGELIALYGTSDDLVVAVVNGSAQDRLGVGVGEPLEVIGVKPA
ncbi:MAG: SAM-dependent chlorinase/fluorinase [Anaerolineaceae bacterium]|nr:SAM-dependent chlorinase/fluorinase [Anaerolineaceae bacterium]